MESPVSIRRRVDFPDPEGPSKSYDLAGMNVKISRSNDLDAISIGLYIELFHRPRLDDRVRHRISLQTFSPTIYVYTGGFEVRLENLRLVRVQLELEACR